MKKNTAKRTFVMSLISLMVCVAMLLGTTYAWFTDSVTSGTNRIVAGDLDVDLVMSTTYDGTYVSISGGTGDIFSDATNANGTNKTLWEPGATHVAYLGVKNNGTLALQYKIYINVTDGGLVGSLNYAIVPFGKSKPTAAIESWTDAYNATGAIKGDVEAGRFLAAEGGCLDEIANDTEGETDYFALVVHMDENAGNEYQGQSVTIDVNIFATQMTAESDSFDNTYDELYAVDSTNGQWKGVETGKLLKGTDSAYITVLSDFGQPTDIIPLTGNATVGNGSLTVDGNTVTYTGGSTGQKVVITTDSASTALVVNAPNDEVTHYGTAASVDIQSVKPASYTENGRVAWLELTKGRVELTKDSNVAKMHISTVSANTFASDVIISVAGDITTLPTFSRDAVTIADNGTKVCTLETVAETKDIFLTLDGIYEQIKVQATGSGEKQWIDESSPSNQMISIASDIANNYEGKKHGVTDYTPAYSDETTRELSDSNKAEESGLSADVKSTKKAEAVSKQKTNIKDELATTGLTLNAASDAELTAALNKVYSDELYWGIPVTIQLAEGTYGSDTFDYVCIFQYPTWNKVSGNGGTENNLATTSGTAPKLKLTIKGGDGVIFTNGICVEGYGYSNGTDPHYSTDDIYTVIDGITFKSLNDTLNENNYPIVAENACSNVTVKNCKFYNTARVQNGTSQNGGIAVNYNKGITGQGGGYCYGFAMEDCYFNGTDGVVQGYMHSTTDIMFKNVEAVNCASFITVTGHNTNSDAAIKLDGCSYSGAGHFIRMQSANARVEATNCTVNITTPTETDGSTKDGRGASIVCYRYVGGGTAILNSCTFDGYKQICFKDDKNGTDYTGTVKYTNCTDSNNNSITSSDFNVIGNGTLESISLGSKDAPILIGTAAELCSFANSVNSGSYVSAYVQLTADIDLSNVEWKPIGNIDHPFEGSISGKHNGNQSYTISNLSDTSFIANETVRTGYTDAEGFVFGLFGIIGSKSGDGTAQTFEYINLENVNITADGGVIIGGLIGSDTAAASDSDNNKLNSNLAENVTLSHISVSGSIGAYNAKAATVGGIVGKLYTKGNITLDNCNCSATLSVGDASKTNTSQNKISGILGYTKGNTSINSCSVTSNITVYGNSLAISGLVNGEAKSLSLTNSSYNGTIDSYFNYNYSADTTQQPDNVLGSAAALGWLSSYGTNPEISNNTVAGKLVWHLTDSSLQNYYGGAATKTVDLSSAYSFKTGWNSAHKATLS